MVQESVVHDRGTGWGGSSGDLRAEDALRSVAAPLLAAGGCQRSSVFCDVSVDRSQLCLHLHVAFLSVNPFLSPIRQLSLDFGFTLIPLISTFILIPSEKNLLPDKVIFWGSRRTWIWGRHSSIRYSLLGGPSKFTSTPRAEYSHTTATSSEVLVHSSSTSRSQTSSSKSRGVKLWVSFTMEQNSSSVALWN